MRFCTSAFLLIVLFLSFQSCNKDDNSDPQPNITMVIDEDFEEEKDWYVFEDEYGSGKVENGCFIFENNGSFPLSWSDYTYHNDMIRDYTIESSFTKLEGNEHFKYGLQILRKDSYNQYLMYLQDNGFEIGYFYNYFYHKIASNVNSGSLHGNGVQDTLKISKVDNHLTFYINGEEVYNYEAEIITGAKCGFKIQNEGKVAIDFIQVYR
ncbi:MAG: hypothetical protein K9H64_01830 [Bacteroidales bacterium]|nr:hypothetical protein [Bacteroidales bacterium]MCF8454715.1 hypothetical protein [Bacteroidales bacterium]